MSAKIIIFEDTEDHHLWIDTNFDIEIMYFSKGFNDDPDEMVDIPDSGQWQFNGIENQSPDHDFDNTWAIGQAFQDSPKRVAKIRQKKHLEMEMAKTQKLLKHYTDEYKKL